MTFVLFANCSATQQTSFFFATIKNNVAWCDEGWGGETIKVRNNVKQPNTACHEGDAMKRDQSWEKLCEKFFFI